MAKDPAFLFYPGDYLQDTQCLGSAAQVAYDRIMCEHMRNICITQHQLNFFTKRLTDEEKSELLMVLDKKKEGYCIPWVVESIEKRRKYSESRRKNREGSKKKKPKYPSKDMLTYDSHMENGDVNENEDINKGVTFPFESENFKSLWDQWKGYRKQQHDFKYASAASEQAALMELSRIAKGQESKAVNVIHQSMANGWKGFFEVNGTDKKQEFLDKLKDL